MKMSTLELTRRRELSRLRGIIEHDNHSIAARVECVVSQPLVRWRIVIMNVRVGKSS